MVNLEQIISFETARLAQEKGCHISSDWYYDLDRKNKLTYGSSDVYGTQQFNNDRAVPTTTQSYLQKYLIDNKDIYITVAPWTCGNQQWFHAVIYVDSKPKCGKLGIWSYEEALEWGLQTVLINAL